MGTYTSVAVVGLVLGLVGGAAAAVGSRAPDEEAAERRALLPALIAGLALALAAFGLSLLGQPPFEAGGSLGFGILYGAAAALATALVALLARPGGSACAAAGCGFAAAAAALVYVLHAPNPHWALVGLPLGGALVLTAVESAACPRRAAGLRAGAAAAGLTLAVLAAGGILAMERYEGLTRAERLAAGQKLWWLLPLVTGAAVAAGQLAGRFAGRYGAPVAAGAAALLVFLFSLPFPQYRTFAVPVAAGAVSGLLLLLQTGGEGRKGGGMILALATGAALLAATYQFYLGYGIALAAAGFLAVAPFATGASQRPFVCVGGLLAAAALYRAFLQTVVADIAVAAHYVLIGLLVGAFLPHAFAAAGQALRGRDGTGNGSARSAAPAFVLALIAAAAAALLILYWGPRAGAGLFLGVALGHAYLLLLAGSDPDDAGLSHWVTVSPSILALLVVLAGHSILDYYNTAWGRPLKIGVAVAVVLALVIASALSSKRPAPDARPADV